MVKVSEPEGVLTLADRRLYNHLLAHAYRSLVDGVRVHSLELLTIRKFAAESRGGVEEVNNRRLKESIERLQRVLVKFDYLSSDGDKIWQSSQLLGTCMLAETKGILTYEFPAGISERLIEPALYSYISLKVIYQFAGKYGLILYEILKRYADRDAESPWWTVKTAELRDLLGCRDKLKDWKDFRKRAIDPALEEIGTLAGFTVDMDEVRQGSGRGGGRVVSVVFHIYRKERQEAEKTIRELDKPKVQRFGEKAGRVENSNAAAALRWLDSADAATRLRWAKEAEHLGVALPPAASARENLAKWVPAIATLIVKAERLKPFQG